MRTKKLANLLIDSKCDFEIVEEGDKGYALSFCAHLKSALGKRESTKSGEVIEVNEEGGVLLLLSSVML